MQGALLVVWVSISHLDSHRITTKMHVACQKADCVVELASTCIANHILQSANRIYRLGESFGLGQFRILCSIEVTRY
jgi:hypothetical protein